MAACIFCRIIKGKIPTLIPLLRPAALPNQYILVASRYRLTRLGEIPCMKLFETEKTLAFLDIGPLSKGHAVSIGYDGLETVSDK